MLRGVSAGQPLVGGTCLRQGAGVVLRKVGAQRAVCVGARQEMLCGLDRGDLACLQQVGEFAQRQVVKGIRG